MPNPLSAVIFALPADWHLAARALCAALGADVGAFRPCAEVIACGEVRVDAPSQRLAEAFGPIDVGYW